MKTKSNRVSVVSLFRLATPGRRATLAAALAGLLALPSAHATTLYWDTNGTATGNGSLSWTWGIDAYWSNFPGGFNAVTGWSSNADAVFSASSGTSGPSYVGVSGTPLANSITFNQSTALTVSGTVKVAGGGITLTSSSAGASFTSSIQLSTSQTWKNECTSDLTAAAVTVAGSSPAVLTLTGPSSGTNAGKFLMSGTIGNGTLPATAGLVINRLDNSKLVVLNSPNTYTGGTTLTKGFVQLVYASSLGGTGNIVNINGGVIGSSSALELANTASYRLGGNFGVGGVVGTAMYRQIKLASNATVDVGNAARSITLYAGYGAVTAANSQLGLKTVALTGTGGTGSLRIVGGPLTAASSPGSLSFEGIATFGSGVGLTIGNNAATVFAGANLIAGNPAVTVEAGGGLNLGDGTAADRSQEIGALYGAGTVLTNTSGTGTAILTLGGSSTGSFSGVVKDSGLGQSTGKIAVTVNKSITTASQTFTGDNTYSGETTVTAGTLLINGTHTGGGAYSVASGATLGGTGSFDAAVAVSGTLAPGDAGIQDLATGPVTFAAGSTLAIKIDTSAVPATADQLVVTGGVTTGGNTVNLTLTGLGADVALAPGTKLVLATYTGTWSDTDVLTYGGNPVPNGSSITYGANSFTVDYSDDSLGGTAMTLTAAQATPFSVWIDSYAALLPNPIDRQATADPDGDGRNNLLEYALNGNPVDVADQGKLTFSTADSSDAGAAPDFSITLAVRTGAVLATSPDGSLTLTGDGLVYHIQGSATLDIFDTPVEEVIPASPLVPEPTAGWTARTFSITDSNNLPDKRFLRVGVSQ